MQENDAGAPGRDGLALLAPAFAGFLVGLSVDLLDVLTPEAVLGDVLKAFRASGGGGVGGLALAAHPLGFRKVWKGALWDGDTFGELGLFRGRTSNRISLLLLLLLLLYDLLLGCGGWQGRLTGMVVVFICRMSHSVVNITEMVLVSLDSPFSLVVPLFSIAVIELAIRLGSRFFVHGAPMVLRIAAKLVAVCRRVGSREFPFALVAEVMLGNVVLAHSHTESMLPDETSFALNGESIVFRRAADASDEASVDCVFVDVQIVVCAGVILCHGSPK